MTPLVFQIFKSLSHVGRWFWTSNHFVIKTNEMSEVSAIFQCIDYECLHLKDIHFPDYFDQLMLL